MSNLELIRAYREDVADSDAARAAARDRLRAHIAASTAPAPRRLRVPSRRVGLSLLALLAICGTATAAGVLLKSDDLHLSSVACLDTASTLEAHRGSAAFVEPAGDPVAACAPLWRAGRLDGHPQANAPALVACASAGQPVIVVPGDPQTCRRLDLNPLPRDYAAAAATLGRAKAILWRDGDLHRPQSRCDHPQAALARARKLLADAGLRNFPIKLAGDAPCAGVYLFDRGANARIETLSHRDAEDHYERRLIGTALEPLYEAADLCESPDRAAERARGLLRDAHLSHVTVRLDGHDEPCLAAGGYEVGHHEVVLGTTSRQENAATPTRTTSGGADRARNKHIVLE